MRGQGMWFYCADCRGIGKKVSGEIALRKCQFDGCEAMAIHWNVWAANETYLRCVDHIR
jgi:hypothetical protein